MATIQELQHQGDGRSTPAEFDRARVEPTTASAPLASESTASQTSSTEPKIRPLPQLPYTLRTRKLAIFVVWTILLADSVVLPVSLFYILKYGAHWDDTRNLGITSGVFGFISLLQYFLRAYRLLRPNSPYRPINAPWWTFDVYHVQYTIAFVVITLILSFATAQSFKIMALTPSAIPLMCGPQFLFSALAYKKEWRLPIRLSSTPKGEKAPPAVFTIIEDIVGVDGRGGKVYRQALVDRYRASPVFRDMLFKLSFAWGLGCCVEVGSVVAIVLTVPKYVGFGLGWCWPFAWGAIGAVATIKWVQRRLKVEEETWEEAQR